MGYNTFLINIAGYPKSKPILEIPFAIIENRAISIKGRWSSGFPESYGELSWYIIPPGSDRENPWTEAKSTVNSKDCDNEAASIINLEPTLELNATKIKIQPHFFPQYLEEAQKYKVESVIQEILVVPGMFDLKDLSKVCFKSISVFCDFADPLWIGPQNYKLVTSKYLKAKK